MKASFSLLALTSALALAAPLNNKRDVVVVTATSEVVETVYSTTTVWVIPMEVNQAPAAINPTPSASSSSSSLLSSSSAAAPSANNGGEFFQQAPPTTAAPSPTSQYVAPAAPSPTTSPAVAVAPPVIQAAPAPPAASPAAVEQAAPSPLPEAQSSSSKPSGTTYTGEITHYTPGMGSCGLTNSDGDAVVAVAKGMMNNGINPNANPWCGKTITISYQGKQTKAKIVDTCPVCKGGDLDLSTSLFQTVAPNGDGRVPGIEWWFD